MGDAVPREEWGSEKVRNWLLALLRFAVTLDDSDGSAVLALAEQIDKLGSTAGGEATFAFFRTTSADVCNAIVARDAPKNGAVLKAHLNRIDDPRLKRAFAAAIGLGGSLPGAGRTRKRRRADLWKGL